MTIQAIMIDLDGTLVHTLGDFAAAINCMLGDMDLPPATTEVVSHAVGQGSDHLIRTVLDHQLGLPGQQRCTGRSVDNLYEPAWQRYQHHYARLNGHHSEVYPGVLNALGLKPWPEGGRRGGGLGTPAAEGTASSMGVCRTRF